MWVLAKFTHKMWRLNPFWCCSTSWLCHNFYWHLGYFPTEGIENRPKEWIFFLRLKSIFSGTDGDRRVPVTPVHINDWTFEFLTLSKYHYTEDWNPKMKLLITSHPLKHHNVATLKKKNLVCFNKTLKFVIFIHIFTASKPPKTLVCSVCSFNLIGCCEK